MAIVYQWPTIRRKGAELAAVVSNSSLALQTLTLVGKQMMKGTGSPISCCPGWPDDVVRELEKTGES
jgi:hypothetical protein